MVICVKWKYYKVLIYSFFLDSNLTEWIFIRKEELAAPAQEIAAPMQEQSNHHQQQQQQPEEQQSTTSRQTDCMETDRPKNRIFSQALGSVLNNNTKRSDFSQRSTISRRSDRSRSRSRSPERRSSRYERHERTSRHEQQRDEKDTRRSGDVFSRIGNAKSDDRRSVFDRLGGSKPIEIPERQHDSKNERCKYWPNCKNGDECIYFHPTTICS